MDDINNAEVNVIETIMKHFRRVLKIDQIGYFLTSDVTRSIF